MNLDEQRVLSQFGQWLRLERGLAGSSVVDHQTPEQYEQTFYGL